MFLLALELSKQNWNDHVVIVEMILKRRIPATNGRLDLRHIIISSYCLAIGLKGLTFFISLFLSLP